MPLGEVSLAEPHNNVVILDYGAGNIYSMRNALERVAGPHQRVVVTRDPQRVAKADRIVLPGVGSYPSCMQKLRNAQLLPALEETVIVRQRPFLGICVGMQILSEVGEEFQLTPGLGWIPGRVCKIATAKRLPHVGWTPLQPRPECPLFASLGSGARDVYFLHSFVFLPTDPKHVSAHASYGEALVAAVWRNNIYGCQFHPEKSGALGLRILERFCQLDATGVPNACAP